MGFTQGVHRNQPVMFRAGSLRRHTQERSNPMSTEENEAILREKGEQANE